MAIGIKITMLWSKEKNECYNLLECSTALEGVVDSSTVIEISFKTDTHLEHVQLFFSLPFFQIGRENFDIV